MKLFVRRSSWYCSRLCYAFGMLAFARPDSGYRDLLNTYSFGAAPGSTSEYFDYITVDIQVRGACIFRGAAPSK